MVEVLQTAQFSKWLKKLRDKKAKAKILARIQRVQEGNLGDHKRFGGFGELRIHCGPGYRVYFTEQNGQTVILLCGGDKGTQGADLAIAARLAKEVQDG